jgi:hypothetical protein
MGLKNWYESDKSSASPSALSVESQTTPPDRVASGMSDLLPLQLQDPKRQE